MPDFEAWGKSLDWYEDGQEDSRIADALKQAFDQGRALGNREAICTTQEWWEEQDSDKTWLDSQTTEE